VREELGAGDVVERNRLVVSICQHRRAVFLDGVVARVEPVERGVELVRLDLDQEAEASEVHAEDGTCRPATSCRAPNIVPSPPRLIDASA
jgi:hypothetical protein